MMVQLQPYGQCVVSHLFKIFNALISLQMQFAFYQLHCRANNNTQLNEYVVEQLALTGYGGLPASFRARSR
jgi:hypothetical protein